MIDTASRAVLFASVLIVLVGYGAVFRPYETAIGAHYAALDAARDAQERALTLARRLDPLAREKTGLERELQHMHAADAPASLVARFLRALAQVSARDAVSVRRVAATAPALGAASVPGDVPLDVDVRGHYTGIIRTIRDLDRRDFAAQIDVASVSDADRRATAHPELDAVFHITLLRESDDTNVPSHTL